MEIRTIAAILAAAVALVPSAAGAAIITYDSKSLFLAETGATDATGAYPNPGNIFPASVTYGSVTLSIGPNTSQFFVGAAGFSSDWTALLPGNDIAIGGPENLNAAFAAPVYSMGFDFVEPTSLNVNATFRDSSFTVSLFQGATLIDTFGFSRPNDVAAFVGVWSDTMFDRAEIREVIPVGTTPADWAENEFYGHFYTGPGARQVTSVPEPGTLLLMGGGLVALAGRRRSRPPSGCVAIA